jgi:CheY-like chemotaxis protein
MDAEIPGYTLLPPELEEFPEDITDIISPGPDNFPVIPGEAKARPVEEEITRDIKGGIPATDVKGKTTPEEIEVPRRELSGPDQDEKTTGPVRKGEGPSVVRSETAIRKPKAERFPQEITGGFEPYEQMIAHESLLVSERAARDEVQIPGRAAEKQILIVDDNDYIVTGLEHMLKKNGYLTASCNSGQEALEILGKKNIDAVLLDLNMEPMSGWQLLGIMRSDVQTKDIPVIIFSAKETLQEEASRTPLKISAFLSKPVNTRLLLSELKKIFEEGDIRKPE